MVMTALAWNLKAWWALSLPEQPGRCKKDIRPRNVGIAFGIPKRLWNAFVRLPCQIIRSGRKLIYRLLSWNPYQPIFFAW